MKGFTAKDVPDQAGKTVFITGANTGLGYEAAKVLAGKNARVIIGCRSTDKARDAREKILAEHPGADVAIVQIDLGSLQSVSRAAAEVGEEATLRHAGCARERADGQLLEANRADEFEGFVNDGLLGLFSFSHILIIVRPFVPSTEKHRIRHS